jgi:thiol-disulfide isomerase/thioredoxin
MLSRVTFLKTMLSVAAVGASPKPAATPSPFPWDVCDQNPALPYNQPLEIKMQVLDGPDFDLLHYRGYPVLINVFATWCEPCTHEMPYLVDVANTYYDRGLRVIGLNQQEADDTVRAYRKRFSIPYPIAMDRRGGFVQALERGVSSADIEFPVTLFMTPDGYLYCYKIGSMSRSELVYRIDKFLREAPPSRRDDIVKPE